MPDQRTLLKQKPSLYMLSYLGFQVNKAIEKGYGNEISFKDVYKGLEERKLFEILDEKLSGVLDISPFWKGSEAAFPGLLNQRNGILNVLSDIALVVEGKEERKFGIKSSGLSLLMAYILEAIQQKSWID
ncbi:hypothetical protein NDI37_25455 [Funiculus sociatus GB2-A5]|uniref:Uncharacterized protein n=1 Tax=Funiculus sociatus GB2-A5 TaxID=2933946 RepID=A0ABV0JWI0_9CYAN|nr:hypothetical protein [Trichocoleus sp. FACHB-6]MBD2060671.1 hypothetical protein [Trichocoleus sp. FACHB-6]